MIAKDNFYPKMELGFLLNRSNASSLREKCSLGHLVKCCVLRLPTQFSREYEESSSHAVPGKAKFDTILGVVSSFGVVLEQKW